MLVDPHVCICWSHVEIADLGLSDATVDVVKKSIHMPYPDANMTSGEIRAGRGGVQVGQS